LRMTALEHQMGDIQRELTSIGDFLRNPAKRYSQDLSELSPAESLRRRRPIMDFT
jgi:hypothetical protein